MTRIQLEVITSPIKVAGNSSNKIKNFVDKYYDNLSDEEFNSAEKEYIEQWHHLLPIKVVSFNWFTFKNILKEHPFLLKKFRELNN